MFLEFLVLDSNTSGDCAYTHEFCLFLSLLGILQETSAIGAKSVAKLFARRFGLLTPTEDASHDGEEL